MGRLKATDEQIFNAAKKFGINVYKTSVDDVNKLAAELQMSDINVWARLRKIRIAYPQQSQNIQQTTTAQQPQQKTAELSAEVKEEIKSGELIPAMNTDYKNREVDNIIGRYSLRNIPVILIGEAGVGKTESVKQLAAKNKLPFLRIACDDSAILKEFLGRRELINGNTIFKAGLLVELLKQPSVILFDEFNCLPPAKLFFLHELLDNRRIFLKDAEEGQVVNLHPQCRLFLACNPNTAKYSGTNRINVALADRCATVYLPELTPTDFPQFFDCGTPDTTKALKQFYNEAKRVIQQQNLRIAFSLRSIKRISESIRNGDKISDALSYGFYNSAYATASDKERDAIEQLAKVCFGISTMGVK